MVPCHARVSVCVFVCVCAGHTTWLIMPYHPVHCQMTGLNNESCYFHMSPWTLSQAVLKLF